MRRFAMPVALSALALAGCTTAAAQAPAQAPRQAVAAATTTSSQTFQASKDTHVRKAYPDAAYGQAGEFYITSIDNRALLAFATPTAWPTGSVVTGGKLCFTPSKSVATALRAYTATDNWSEATTWNSQPPVETTVVGDTPGDLVAGYRSCIALSPSEIETGGTEYRVQAVTASIPAYVATSEHATVGARPTLTVDLSTTVPDPTPTPSPTPTTASPTPDPTPTPDPDGTTAAKLYGWGSPTAGDEFNYSGAPDSTKWSVYNGAGHAGNGTRSPANAHVDGTYLRMDGLPDGSGAGMSSKYDRAGSANVVVPATSSGRWETRARVTGPTGADYRSSGWHPVLIVWPDAGRIDANGCQELDYAEGTTDVTKVNTYLHYACPNVQSSASKLVDQRQWHNYAVEWAPDHVTTWVDGEVLYTTTDPAKTPDDPSHSTIQLDNFLGDLGESHLDVDWTRYYATGPAATPTTTTTATASPTAAALQVAAVGDISPPGSSTNAAATAKLAAAAGVILGLGDYQYQDGALTAYNAYFDKAWGPNVPKMYPVLAPNHDQYWRDAGPLRYFNGAGATGRKAPVTLAPHRSYSFDRGGWHFLAIDDSCYRDTANCSTSALLSWVKADLAAHPARCTLAYWHQPYWTSPTASHGRFTDVAPVVQALYDAGADLVLNGHQHGYERFAPQNPAGARDDAHGLRQFTVGTGGIGFYPFTGTAANSVTKQADTYGVLQLALKDGSYDWRFARAAGGSYTDAGTGTCH